MAKLRSKQQIAERIVALVACHRRAHLDKRSDIEKELGREFLAALTPRERAFYKAAKPAFHERAERSWGVEAAVVLLWTIGLGPRRLPALSKLSKSQPVCDLVKEHKVIGLAQTAGLRSAAEIDQTLEMVEQAHWRVRDAAINGRTAPKSLNPDLILMWHHALNWVTRFCDEDWDDVTTDT